MEITITIKLDDDELKDIQIEREEAIKEKETEVTHSQYARFFDEGSPMWQKDTEYNLAFLLTQQNYCTELLKSKGHLFLNDVYCMLGLPKTKAGHLVGWIYDHDNPNHIGDNYVDFGIFTNEKSADFVNGYENSILLDFNVDGYIWDDVNWFKTVE